MEITFHLVPKSYFDALNPGADYAPADFARDGFIHCTDAPQDMESVANLYYRQVEGAHYYLHIDKARVRAPVRYDDAAHQFPHIYGTLNRDAIVTIRTARRLDDGTFLAPEPEPD